ncbi:MAG: DUF3761 domain-containing protein [Chitinophagales bacterium]|nr:DUF3761 domain-containing protein [Chitinophagales bacterium]
MRYLFLIFSFVLFGFNIGVAQNNNALAYRTNTYLDSYVVKQKTITNKKSKYVPDNNPVTWDEDPSNYPLEKPHTYINSYQKEVQSPTKYNAVPPGACAVCRDGSYSFSKNRRGTCSKHGGVLKWLK